MNLGIFLSPSESLNSMEKTGQDARFIELYLKRYSKNFKKIYIFSYENEKVDLSKNVTVVANKTKLPRLIYAILLPLINRKNVNDCDVIRGFGLASSLSAILAWKPFIFNWAFDYIQFAKIEKKFIYVPLYFLLEKIAFLKAAKVFIATRAKFSSLHGRKFTYLPNGVDLKLFKNQPAANGGLVYVGRLEKQKNLFFVLDSLELLPESMRKITFIGAGSEQEALKKYAGKKSIKLMIDAPVKHSQLPEILKNYKIFTLPSFAEGSPKVLLEAMALGLVPVVNNFDTAKDVITNGENGFIVDFNQKEFARKIMELINNPALLERISKNAISTIRDGFDQEKLIKKEISILKNV